MRFSSHKFLTGRRLGFVPLFLLAASISAPVSAQEAAPNPVETGAPKATESRGVLDKAARIGSDSLGPFMLLAGAGIAARDDYRSQRIGRSAAAIGATGALTLALKKLVKEERPNGANENSFPSGHASLSFATATLIDAYQPKYKGVGYAWATWISLSRVQVRAHYLHDVAAGAVLGHFVTKAFTKKYRGSDDNNVPINAPAAVQPNWMTPGAQFGVTQSDRWQVNLTAGGLGIRKSW